MKRGLVLAVLLTAMAGVLDAQTVITGTDIGLAPHVKRYLGAGTTASFFAFAVSYTGGVTVAHGDVNGDGTLDIIVGAASSIAHVKVFDGATLAEIASFFAFSGAAIGINVAAGDVNGDGYDDVIVGAATDTTHVQIFSGPSMSLIASFFAFGSATTGVNVGAADYDGDGLVDVIAGAASVVTHVKVLKSPGLGELASFFAYPSTATGVFVAGADFDGDGKGDILTAPSTLSPHVKLFRGGTLEVLASFFAFDAPFTSGARVGAGDTNGDFIPDMVVSSGPGRQIEVKKFAYPLALLGTITPYGSATAGAFVAGGTPRPAATITGNTDRCSGSAEIMVNLTGRPPWTLRWSDGATTGGITSSPYTRVVETAGTFTLTGVSDLNHGNGTTSGSAVVAEGLTPEITSEPADTTIDAGQEASLSVTASPATSYQWYQLSGQSLVLIQGATSATLNVQPASTTRYVVRVRNDTCDIYSRVAAVFVRPHAPATVEALAASASMVEVSWSSVTAAASYEVFRSSGGGPFVSQGIVAGTFFSQSGLSSNTTYLYRVRTIDHDATASLDSVIDWATTIVFADDPLVAGATPVRAQHILQLQTAVNAFRAAAGLPALSFASITPSVTTVQAAHVSELRSGYDAARTALSLPLPGWTDSLIAGTTVIRVIHVAEIRLAVK